MTMRGSEAFIRIGLGAAHVVRRTFAAAVRAHIRSLVFRWFDLRWSLPSGLLVRVRSRPRQHVSNNCTGF